MAIITKRILGALLAFSLILAGCSAAPAETEATPQPDTVLTAAAQTADARLTELAQPTATATETTVPAVPTEIPMTVLPLEPSPIVTGTLPVGGTAVSTLPPAGGTPGATTGSDLAAYVADVTIPDGTEMQPGESFTKTWRLQNAGTSTWTTDYNLAFLGGDQMGGPESVPLTQSVAPGETVDISVDLVAPQGAGTHRSNWEMRNAAGEFFPIAVYVEIVVGGGGGTAVGGSTAVPSGSGSVSNPTLIVDNPSPDECPNTFVFTASFTLSQPTTITYGLDVDVPFENVSLPGEQSTSFQQAGTQTVAYELDFSGSFSGSAQFYVSSPNEVSSNTVTFACP